MSEALERVGQLIGLRAYSDAERVADEHLTVEERALFQPHLKPAAGEFATFRRVWKETHESR